MGLAEGDPAVLIDPKGRHFLLKLESGRTFQYHQGSVPHDALIGASDGSRSRMAGPSRSASR